MDPSALTDCFGTYRVQQDLTPSQRRVLRRWSAVLLLALVTWPVVQLLREGSSAAADILILVVVGAVAGAISPLVGRRLGPLTRLDATGITSSTGLTGGRRSVGWQEVAYIDAAQRFEVSPVAVLSDGARLELPGLPAGVIARLNAALGATPPATSPPPQPPAESAEGDEGWDGPFRRG